MPVASSKRTAEVRLLVIVFVDLKNPELTDVLKPNRQPSSIREVVGQEVLSNLESVTYVDTAIVSEV